MSRANVGRLGGTDWLGDVLRVYFKCLHAARYPNQRRPAIRRGLCGSAGTGSRTRVSRKTTVARSARAQDQRRGARVKAMAADLGGDGSIRDPVSGTKLVNLFMRL